LWALFFADPARLHTGTEIKIVWRMTGAGDLSIAVSGPAGRTIRPAWGPEPHGGSTWQRPGDEWGTGWIFPAPGRWIFHAARTRAGTGELTIQVT